MSTTIRITDEDKDRLRRVQRRLTDLTGERMTLQRILGLMARHAEAAPEHIAGLDDTPPTPIQVKRLRALQGQYGPTDARHVDEWVYR